MIEALIVCTQLLAGQDCVSYNYTPPLERTEENEALVVEHCTGIVLGMMQEGFVVTCEEAARDPW